MDLRDQIEAHKELITDRLHTDFGLLDELLASQSLTRPEVAMVKEVSNWYGRSEKLLVYVSNKGIYEKFFDALKDTQQTHLANFILSKGERRHEFGDDWPLTEREISILDKNQRILVDLLETCDLLPRLYSHEVIYKRQRDFLSSKTVSHEKNEALLEILRRTSLQNYKKTIHCLHLSKQSHIADLFKEGGGIVRVRSELETETDVDDVEDELVTKFTEILGDYSLEDSARILENTQLRLIALKKGHSIILYFLCKASADLVNLQEMQTSGKLTNVVREMFNKTLSSTQVINLRTTLYDEDFSKVVDAKGKLEESCDEDDLSATSNSAMNDLPLELLDLILVKVYEHSSVIRSQLGQPTDEEIIRSMASVDFCWFQSVIRRKFKNIIWRNLKEFYRKYYKRPVICRNTRLYLVENIQTKGLLDRLRSVDCLTDIQTRLVNRGKDKSRKLRGKKEDLLHLAKSLDDSRYSTFVRCLRESKQTLCTRVLTNGGVVVKAEIQCSNLKNRKSVKQQMVKILNDLRDKTNSKAAPLEQQLNRLKDENIELLDSLLDRIPVVWLLCHSALGLTKLQTNSDFVLKLINVETIAKPSEIVNAKTVNIDSDRFRKEVGEMDLRDLIEAHNDQIMNSLDPDSGLLDELFASRSLTRQEVTEVKAVSDSYGRSGKLLKYVIDKGIYEKFLNALRNTQQTHLVNFILSNGAQGRGLQNLGHTCYINSTMQALIHTNVVFYHELQNVPMKGEFVLSVLRFYSAMKAKNSTPYSPTDLHRVFGRKSPKFADYKQHDSHEYYRAFLDNIRKEERYNSEAVDKRKVLTVVDRVFGGHFMTVYICTECEVPYHVCEQFLDISLPIVFNEKDMSAIYSWQSSHFHSTSDRYRQTIDKLMAPLSFSSPYLQNDEAAIKKHYTVDDCLMYFTRKEHLDKEYLCNDCYAKHLANGAEDVLLTSATKQTMIFNPPAILTLHLKRFELKPGRSVKRTDMITYGELLDIAPYCSSMCLRNDPPCQNIWYSLYGVVVHHGSTLKSGHYIAYVKIKDREAGLKKFLQEKYFDRDLTREQLIEMMQERQPGETYKQPGGTYKQPGGTWYCMNDDPGRTYKQPGGTWYCMNDEYFHEVSVTEILNQQAYLLFYERMS